MSTSIAPLPRDRKGRFCPSQYSFHWVKGNCELTGYGRGLEKDARKESMRKGRYVMDKLIHLPLPPHR